jgi:hypothetical protein
VGVNIGKGKVGVGSRRRRRERSRSKSRERSSRNTEFKLTEDVCSVHTNKKTFFTVPCFDDTRTLFLF